MDAAALTLSRMFYWMNVER